MSENDTNEPTKVFDSASKQMTGNTPKYTEREWERISSAPLPANRTWKPPVITKACPK